MDRSSTYLKEKKYKKLIHFINNELEYIDYLLSLKLNSKNDLDQRYDVENLLTTSNHDEKMTS
tara:strand:+ start:1112 stop:1300 length:189 start_codon:yes stop_codon:yes gene_type:complete